MWATWRVEMPFGYTSTYSLRSSNRPLVAILFTNGRGEKPKETHGSVSWKENGQKK